jgi:glutamate dehydrogenase
VLDEEDRIAYGQAVDNYLGQSIEASLSRRLATLSYLFPACEVVAVAEEVGLPVIATGRVYFALDARLQLGKLQQLIERTSPRNHWERHALAGLYEDLFREHRRLTTDALRERSIRSLADSADGSVDPAIAAWLEQEVAGYGRWQRLLAELDTQASPDLAMLSVAVRALGTLVDVIPEAAD